MPNSFARSRMLKVSRPAAEPAKPVTSLGSTSSAAEWSSSGTRPLLGVGGSLDTSSLRKRKDSDGKKLSLSTDRVCGLRHARETGGEALDPAGGPALTIRDGRA